jgi:glycosyltransferase involved in cell wall biosynthesis
LIGTAAVPRVQRAPVVSAPSLAIVHDYLTQRGGAERVVLALHEVFPDAPIHTSLFDPSGTFPEFARLAIEPSPLNRVRPLRRHHRLALPLLAPTFTAMEIAADVVVCSSSGWAHGVRTDGRKVVYCYAPARWLYQTDVYLAGRRRAARVAIDVLGPTLRRWDRSAAHSAHVYLTTSTHSRRAIREAYGVDAEVLPPPCEVDVAGSRHEVPDLEPGFILCVSRLASYKHVDAVLAAFDGLPTERIVVVGAGPEAARLRHLAPRNAVFLPRVSDSELRWLYESARAVVAASYEDFGLTPVEGAMFGTPAIVLRFGGYLDTVVDGVTGLFFEQPTPAAIAHAVGRFDAAQLDPDAVRRHAQQFSRRHFAERFRAIVGDHSSFGAGV